MKKFPIMLFTKIKNKLSKVNRSIRIKIIKKIYTQKAKKKEKILFWNSGGGSWHDLIYVDGVISNALQLRGHQTHAIIFDGTYKSYAGRDIFKSIDSEAYKKDSIKDVKATESFVNEMDIEYSKFGDYLSEYEKKEAFSIANNISYDDVEEFEYKGLKIGKYIKSSLTRYLMGKEYSSKYRIILSEVCYGAILHLIVVSKVIEKIKPTKVFMSHAIYIDWGVALKFLISKNIQVFVFMEGRVPATYYFKRVTDYIDISPDKCHQITWEKEVKNNFKRDFRKKCDEYIFRRYFKNKSSDIIFDLENKESIAGFKDRYSLINEKRPLWAIFCHINWDASGDLYKSIYSSFKEWFEKTFNEIVKNKNVVWLIKLHPLETKESRIITNKFIKQFSNLKNADNIKIIDYDEKLNPFLFQKMISGGVTVNGTSGLEAAMQGKPIILAGKPSYGGRGFTIDCDEVSNYVDTLKNAHKISLLTQNQIELAYKYCYLYFFRKQIKLPIFNDPFNKSQSAFIIQNDRLGDLIPGKEENLSFICDCIINDKEFVLEKAQY